MVPRFPARAASSPYVVRLLLHSQALALAMSELLGWLLLRTLVAVCRLVLL